MLILSLNTLANKYKNNKSSEPSSHELKKIEKIQNKKK
jgi:hypothetical protein